MIFLTETDKFTIPLPVGWWVVTIRLIIIFLSIAVLVALPTSRLGRIERRQVRRWFNVGMSVILAGYVVGLLSRLDAPFTLGLPFALVGVSILFIGIIKDTRSGRKERNARRSS